MGEQEYWENIYATKAPTAVSWFRFHLETSIALIERAAPRRSSSIIDVGGGTSTLVDDLIARRYRNITVLDISQAAIDLAKARLAEASESIRWLRGDVTQANLPVRSYDLWHDRAVFHFFTKPEQRLCVRSKRRLSRQTRGARNYQHFWSPGSSKMQRPRCHAIRCRIPSRRIWPALPLGREFKGIASYAVWDHPAISLLLLHV
jgi:SAM-dependent methyltransferase